MNTSSYNGKRWLSDQRLISNYTTAPDTRQLSITSISGTNSTQSVPTNGTVNQSLLLYEDSGGNVAALLQVQQLCPIINTEISDCYVDGSSYFGSYWLDVTRINHSIPRSELSPVNYKSHYDAYAHHLTDGSVIVSSTLYESHPGANFSSPFATGASAFEKELGLNVDLLICYDSTQTSALSSETPSFCNKVAYTTYRSWSNASHGFFEFRMQNLFTTLQHGSLADSLY